MKKRLLALLCAVALLLGVLALSAGAASEERVYFMGVNESVLALSDDTMPRVVNGVLYVPYTMLDANSTPDADLGLFGVYNRAKSTVMIYSRSQAMVFDLSAGNSTAGGVTYRDRAIIRNSMAFIPLDMVCTYFGLTWSLLTVDYGYLVRVCNDEAVLNNALYIDAAATAVRSQYYTYLQRKAAEAEPSAEPSTSVTPEAPSGNGAQVYLGLRLEDGEGLTSILGLLERYGLYAIFFCPVDDLARRDDDIRTLIAQGHRVGLLLDADTLDGQLAQAEEGRALLAHVARAEPTGYLSEHMTDSDFIALSDLLPLWITSLDATPQERSATRQAEVVTGGVRSNRRYYALLDDSAQSATALGRILSTLTNSGADFLLATEVVLGGL